MAPGKVDLAIYQGDDFELGATFTADGAPFVLTGYSFAAQIRTAPADDAPGTPEADLTCTITDAALGKLAITLTNTETVALPTTGALVWDLQGTKAGVITTFLRGAVVVTAEVTR